MSIDSIKMKKFCELTGYTVAAVKMKISRGVWLNGREYTKAPDGNILMSIQGYENWINTSRERIPTCMK